jgi:hypothetical protein
MHKILTQTLSKRIIEDMQTPILVQRTRERSTTHTLPSPKQQLIVDSIISHMPPLANSPLKSGSVRGPEAKAAWLYSLLGYHLFQYTHLIGGYK